MENFTNGLCTSIGKPIHEDEVDEDLVGHFMHRYFDGDLTTLSNPLLAQLPNHLLDSVQQEKIAPMTTIHVPLENTTTENHIDGVDGYHTFEGKDELLILENAILFCCDGINSKCEPTKFRQMKFKKIPPSEDYPNQNLFLQKWPYVHNVRHHDQLAAIVSAFSSHHHTTTPQLHNEPNQEHDDNEELCQVCIEDKYIEQNCFYQTVSLVNTSNHGDIK